MNEETPEPVEEPSESPIVVFRHRDGTTVEVSDPGDVWRYDQHPNWHRR